MGEGRHRVLVVDDVPDLLEVVTTYLEAVGFDAVGCTDARGALAALDEGSFDVALIDQRLRGDDGIALVTAVHRRDPGLPVALMSGAATAPPGCAAAAFAAKPFLLRELAGTLDQLAG
jgi:DNA-binding NtrC family response regulator